MIQIALLEKIIIVLVNVFGFWLAFWVYGADKKNRLNQWFFVMTFFVVFWVDFALLGRIIEDRFYAITFYKLNFLMVAFFLISSFYFYVVNFLKINFVILRRVILIIGLLLASLCLFSSFIIKDVVNKPWGNEIVFGGMNNFFNLYALVVALVVIGFMIKKYFSFSKIEKLKTQYFLIGTTLFALSNIVFNVVVPLFTNSVVYYAFGDYSAILLLGFTALAIVKQNLFGIKIILTQLFVGLIAILLLIDFLTSASIFEYIWKGAVLAGFTFFSWFLIKSVIHEVEQKNKIEAMSEDVKRAYEVEKQARQELQRIDEVKSQFIMATQHHLRTPLTALKGYLSMILEGDFGKINEIAREKLGFCFESTNRLIKLVNEFLDISKLQMGRDILEIKEASIIELLQDVIVEVKPEADKKGIYLTLTLPQRNIPLAMADSIKLREALYNLIDNAVKYTEKGGVKVDLSLINKNGKDFLLITIADTGIGMTKEEAADVFGHQFERGKEAKKVYALGRGIGLYIAASIIKAHKGKIWAESSGPGKGSLFHVELVAKK